MSDRTVEIRITNGNLTKIAETIGTWDKLFTAIGYLATWGMVYPHVTIYGDGETDLLAVYSKDDGERGCTIGAVWHGDHYGFHS